MALALAVLALLVVVWMLTSGGGDDDKTDGANKSSPPASSITPGPKPSGPAISQQPGGRDETGDGDSTGGDTTGGPSEGADGSGGTGTDDGGTSQGTGGSGGAGGSGGSEGRPVAVGSNLPNCSTDTLKLSLEPTKLTYPLGEKPGFRLKAVNSSSGDCKVDLGRSSAVLTVTDSDDERIWSSNDCPRDLASLLLRVPANTTITHTYEWDRSRSTGHCSTAAPAKVGAGTYLLEAKFPGENVSPASFVLAKD